VPIVDDIKDEGYLLNAHPYGLPSRPGLTHIDFYQRWPVYWIPVNNKNSRLFPVGFIPKIYAYRSYAVKDFFGGDGW
jgi:hypothetical protein